MRKALGRGERVRVQGWGEENVCCHECECGRGGVRRKLLLVTNTEARKTGTLLNHEKKAFFSTLSHHETQSLHSTVTSLKEAVPFVDISTPRQKNKNFHLTFI